MSTIGYYEIVEDQLETDKDASEYTYERIVAFDTEAGQWKATSSPVMIEPMVQELGTEPFEDATTEEIIDLFVSYNEGARSGHIFEESDVPGTVKVRDDSEYDLHADVPIEKRD